MKFLVAPLLVPSLLVVATAALAGCASDIPPATALVDGPATAAPAGWVSYCERHAEDPGCRP